MLTRENAVLRDAGQRQIPEVQRQCRAVPHRIQFAQGSDALFQDTSAPLSIDRFGRVIGKGGPNGELLDA